LLAICLEIDPDLKYTLYIQAGTHTHTPLLLHLKAFCCTCKSFDTMQLTDKEEKPSISLRQLTANEALTQIKEKKIRFFKGIHWNHRRKQLKKKRQKGGERVRVCVRELRLCLKQLIPPTSLHQTQYFTKQRKRAI